MPHYKFLMYFARRNKTQHEVKPVENLANSENCRLCRGISIFSERICKQNKDFNVEK